MIPSSRVWGFTFLFFVLSFFVWGAGGSFLGFSKGTVSVFRVYKALGCFRL